MAFCFSFSVMPFRLQDTIFLNMFRFVRFRNLVWVW